MYRDPTIEGTAPPLCGKIMLVRRVRDRPLPGRDRSGHPLARRPRRWGGRSGWPCKRRRRVAGRARDPPAIVAPFVVADARVPRDADGAHRHAPHLPAPRAVGGARGACSRRRAFPEAVGGARPPVDPGARRRRGRRTCSSTARSTRGRPTTRRASSTTCREGSAATAVIWESGTWAFRNGTLTHLAAYYAARKHGQWAFAFARYLSVPVRFKPGSQPAWPAHGWEFDGEQYDPRCKYARAFPLVIVKAPAQIADDATGEKPLRRARLQAGRPGGEAAVAPRALLGVRHGGAAGRRHAVTGDAMLDGVSR